MNYLKKKWEKNSYIHNYIYIHPYTHIDIYIIIYVCVCICNTHVYEIDNKLTNYSGKLL